MSKEERRALIIQVAQKIMQGRISQDFSTDEDRLVLTSFRLAIKFVDFAERKLFYEDREPANQFKYPKS